MSRLEPTEEEAKAIQALKRLAKKWPDSLWLFAAAGTLTVMRKGPDGGHAFNGEAVDQAFIVGEVPIECDGGDW